MSWFKGCWSPTPKGHEHRLPSTHPPPPCPTITPAARTVQFEGIGSEFGSCSSKVASTEEDGTVLVAVANISCLEGGWIRARQGFDDPCARELGQLALVPVESNIGSLAKLGMGHKVAAYTEILMRLVSYDPLLGIMLEQCVTHLLNSTIPYLGHSETTSLVIGCKLEDDTYQLMNLTISASTWAIDTPDGPCTHPALLLKHSFLDSLQVPARMVHERCILSQMSKAATVTDHQGVHVLYQNPASIKCHGLCVAPFNDRNNIDLTLDVIPEQGKEALSSQYADGLLHGGEVRSTSGNNRPPPTQVSNLLQWMFQYEPQELADALSRVQQGHVWTKVLRVPARMQRPPLTSSNSGRPPSTKHSGDGQDIKMPAAMDAQFRLLLPRNKDVAELVLQLLRRSAKSGYYSLDGKHVSLPGTTSASGSMYERSLPGTAGPEQLVGSCSAPGTPTTHKKRSVGAEWVESTPADGRENVPLPRLRMSDDVLGSGHQGVASDPESCQPAAISWTDLPSALQTSAWRHARVRTRTAKSRQSMSGRSSTTPSVHQNTDSPKAMQLPRIALVSEMSSQGSHSSKARGLSSSKSLSTRSVQSISTPTTAVQTNLLADNPLSGTWPCGSSAHAKNDSKPVGSSPGLAHVQEDGVVCLAVSDMIPLCQSFVTDCSLTGRTWWYHEVTALPFMPPGSDAPTMLLIQGNVTARVEAELALAEMTDAQLLLLEQIFPRHVLQHMTTHNHIMGTSAFLSSLESLAAKHTGVTVFFMDVCGFTNMSKQVEPYQVMKMLSLLFSRLDDLVDEHGLYKIETAGDSYLVAANLMAQDEDGFQVLQTTCATHCDELGDGVSSLDRVTSPGQDMYGSVNAVITRAHGTADGRTSQQRPGGYRKAEAAVGSVASTRAAIGAVKLFMFARAALLAAQEVKMPHTGELVQVRVGLHTGELVSGVIGTKLPKFGLFGDTMNTGARMEQTCAPGCIQLSAATRALLPAFMELPATGGVEVKGKGMMETFIYNPATSPLSDEHVKQLQHICAMDCPCEQSDAPPSTFDLRSSVSGMRTSRLWKASTADATPATSGSHTLSKYATALSRCQQSDPEPLVEPKQAAAADPIGQLLAFASLRSGASKPAALGYTASTTTIAAEQAWNLLVDLRGLKAPTGDVPAATRQRSSSHYDSELLNAGVWARQQYDDPRRLSLETLETYKRRQAQCRMVMVMEERS